MSTNDPHLAFVDINSLLLPELKVCPFNTPEAPRIHHHSPSHLPVIGTCIVKGDDMSLSVVW